MKRVRSGNIIAIGETFAGKTSYLNELNYTFTGLGVLVDTKGGPQSSKLWGRRISSFENFSRLQLESDTFVYDPPRMPARDVEGVAVNWPVAHRHLKDLWDQLRAAATNARWEPTDEEPLWFQVLITEIHKWREPYLDSEGKRRPAPSTVDEMASQIAGFGGRLVGDTQYAAAVDPEMRTNFPTRIVFRPGLEGANVLRQWQWPVDEIDAWTKAAPHQFVSYHPELSWRKHRARPRGSL